MSPVLSFDILALIIDIVGEDEDTALLKVLALVCRSFLEMCSKYLFATVDLRDAVQRRRKPSSKKGFIKLLESRPEIVKYIRKLMYKVGVNDRFQSLPTDSESSLINVDDDLLSPILPNSLRSIPRLNYLEIYASYLDWNTMDSLLTSAFLHLMNLPSMNHIDLTCINNFPLDILSYSVNLLRLDLTQVVCVDPLEEDGSPGYVVQSEITPKIRVLHISESFETTMKLVLAKTPDGRPAFKFVDLRQLSIAFTQIEDKRFFQHFLQNAMFLHKLELSLATDQNLVGLHHVLFLRARTLKIFQLSINLQTSGPDVLPLGGLCGELEAMAGRNMLESLSFDVLVELRHTEDFIGPIIQGIETALVKPGCWPALKEVNLKLICLSTVTDEIGDKFCDSLQSLPEKYLSHLSEHNSIDFDYTTESWT